MISKKGFITFSIIFVLFFMIGVGGGYALSVYNNVNKTVEKIHVEDTREENKSVLREKPVDPKMDDTTILLMGIDENEKRGKKESEFRTDALIFATVNTDDESVKLLSIPRDSYVYLPVVDKMDKINHAHAFGGTEATIEAVEGLLNIPVDYYAKIDFHAFVDVVNAMGGIDIEVPYEFKESDSNDKKDAIHLMEGKQKLNGEETLALARTRKKDSDMERGKRQLEIIDAMFDKVTASSSVLKYNHIIDAIGDNTSTNMSFDDMKSYFSLLVKSKDLKVDKLSLGGIDYQPNKVYYWKLDEDELHNITNELKRHIGLETSDTEGSDDDTTLTGEGIGGVQGVQ